MPATWTVSRRGRGELRRVLLCSSYAGIGMGPSQQTDYIGDVREAYGVDWGMLARAGLTVSMCGYGAQDIRPTRAALAAGAEHGRPPPLVVCSCKSSQAVFSKEYELCDGAMEFESSGGSTPFNRDFNFHVPRNRSLSRATPPHKTDDDRVHTAWLDSSLPPEVRTAALPKVTNRTEETLLLLHGRVHNDAAAARPCSQDNYKTQLLQGTRRTAQRARRRSSARATCTHTMRPKVIAEQHVDAAFPQGFAVEASGQQIVLVTNTGKQTLTVAAAGAKGGKLRTVDESAGNRMKRWSERILASDSVTLPGFGAGLVLLPAASVTSGAGAAA